MKDYRTWWRKGIDAAPSIGGSYARPPNHDLLIASQSDEDDWDCILEQLWAICESLA